MNKSNIIDAIHSNSEYTRSEIEDIVKQVFDLILIGLQQDGKVTISNFGRFEKVYQPAYVGVHPITGEQMEVKENYRIHFISSNNVKTLIKK